MLLFAYGKYKNYLQIHVLFVTFKNIHRLRCKSRGPLRFEVYRDIFLCSVSASCDTDEEKSSFKTMLELFRKN